MQDVDRRNQLYKSDLAYLYLSTFYLDPRTTSSTALANVSILLWLRPAMEMRPLAVQISDR